MIVVFPGHILLIFHSAFGWSAVYDVVFPGHILLIFMVPCVGLQCMIVVFPVIFS